MKASLLCLMLSWLPPLAAQTLDHEPLERAVLPLELAAVTLTPTASSTFSPSTDWGYVPLESSTALASEQSRREPVVLDAGQSSAVAHLSIAELFKKDPLGVVATRSRVPELTTTALWGTIALAAFVIGQAVRRQWRWA